MRILTALLLTLSPAMLGLSLYFWSVYPFTIEELGYQISRQLWYVDFFWLCISWGVNWFLLRQVNKRIKPNLIILQGGTKHDLKD